MPARLSAIKQISVNARDLPRATAFYRDSLGIRHLFDAPPQMSFFDCGGIRLLVGVAEKGEFDHPSSILYFAVDDIKSAHADLVARGVAFRDAPHLAARLPDREIWLAFFNDSEGNVHALISEVAPKGDAAAAAPWRAAPAARHAASREWRRARGSRCRRDTRHGARARSWWAPGPRRR